jgi:hypothetical protein
LVSTQAAIYSISLLLTGFCVHACGHSTSRPGANAGRNSATSASILSLWLFQLQAQHLCLLTGQWWPGQKICPQRSLCTKLGLFPSCPKPCWLLTRRVERTEGSRYAQRESERQWRLPPAAHPESFGLSKHLNAMTQADENELQRLAQMLETLDIQLPSSSPVREALTKAGIALSVAFMGGSRTKIEFDYNWWVNLKNKTK